MFLALVAVVLIANGPYIVGIFDPNPLAARSGLAIDVKAGRLLGEPTIDPNNGFVSQALSYRAMVDLIHGHLPWWNPYEGLGSPLAAELQSGALFPFTLPVLAAGGQLLELLMLQLLTAWATYLVLKGLNQRRAACFAGAALFALNGTFAWFAHAPIHPIAFLPLVILGIERAYRAATEGRRGGWALLAVAGAFSFLGGFPEVTYIDTLLALVWVLWRLGCIRQTGIAVRATARRFSGRLVLGAFAAALLAAPLLVALLAYLPHADAGAHSGNGYANGHLSQGVGLPGLVLPYVFGPIFAFTDPAGQLSVWWSNVGGYLTVGALFLAFLGIAGRQYRVLKLLLVVFTYFVLARTFDLPLGSLVNRLPGMGNVAFYRYSWPALEFAIAILAAFGFDGVVRARPRLRTLAGCVLACAAVVGAAAIKARPLVQQLGTTFAVHHFYRYAVGLGIAVVVIGALAMLIRPASVRTAVVLLVVLVEAMWLFALPELSAPRSVKVDQAPITYLRAHLDGQRFFTLGPVDPNYGSYFGLKELDANDVPVPKAFATFVTKHLAPSADPLVFVGFANVGAPAGSPTPGQDLIANVAGYRAAAVAYVLTTPGTTLPSTKGFTLVKRTPTTWIYHLSDSSPYYTVSSGCHTSAVSTETVTVTCARSGRLIKRELYMPGWSASIDAKGTPVRSTLDGFQAVRLPRGRSVVSFSFSPPHEWVGWVGLCLGLLLLAGRALGAKWLPFQRHVAAAP